MSRGLAVALEPGHSLCHRCGRVTQWQTIRGGRLACSGCRDVFPCRHDCGHVDCAAATGAPLPEGIREARS